MSRDASFYIVDILIAILKSKEYTKKFSNASEFKWSMLEWDATIRQLEIIGEAVKHLIRLNILDNSKYRKIVDFRNLITHAYFGIDEDEVWYVVNSKLDELFNELKEISIEKNINLKDAIECAIEENFKNQKLVKKLKGLNV